MEVPLAITSLCFWFIVDVVMTASSAPVVLLPAFDRSSQLAVLPAELPEPELEFRAPYVNPEILFSGSVGLDPAPFEELDVLLLLFRVCNPFT